MVELAVVFVVVATIAAIAVPTASTFIANSKVKAAQLTLAGVLSEARALKVIDDDSATWEDAVMNAIDDLSSDEIVFAADGFSPRPTNAGSCAFDDGSVVYPGTTYVCDPGGGTRRSGSVVYADSTKWTVSLNPSGWNAVSLHTRHILVWPSHDHVVVSLAAGKNVWAFGRAQGGTIQWDSAAPATPPGTTPPTTAPSDDAELPGDDPGEPTPPGDEADPSVWDESEANTDPATVVEVTAGSENQNPSSWWVGKKSSDCHFSGWASNFPPGLFRNRGDCQSYFSSQGKKAPMGPSAHLYPMPPL